MSNIQHDSCAMVNHDLYEVLPVTGAYDITVFSPWDRMLHEQYDSTLLSLQKQRNIVYETCSMMFDVSIDKSGKLLIKQMWDIIN